jgi:capsular exopolysaccharide synthesis family protein
VRRGRADAFDVGRARGKGLSNPMALGSRLGEQLRMLRTRVKDIATARPFRCFGITSTEGGEGKTTVCLGLAAALAQEPGCRVLVIEADTRKPSIERALGLPQSEGLGEWLSGSDSRLAVRTVQPDGFSLLSVGLLRGLSPELLGSARMAQLITTARAYYDFALLDCPPVLPVADSVLLQDLLDGFLFVVRARHSPREAIVRAASQLKADRIQGVVFNDHRTILSRYDYGAYRYEYRA